MKHRAPAPLLALVVPVLAIAACGGSVDDERLFGTSSSSSSATTGTAATTGGAGGGATTSSTSGTTSWTTGAGGTGTTTTDTTTTSTTSTTTTSGAGGAGGGPHCASFGDACTGCMAQSCAATWCGCAENQACLDLFSCANGCGGDKGCLQGCYEQNPDGVSAATLVSGCAGTTCNADCGWGAPVPPCQTCLATDCASEYGACIGDAECVALYQCLTGCKPGDLVCQQGCYDQHGGAVETLQALLDCSKQSCAGTCN